MPTTQPAFELLSLLDAYDTDAECRAYLEDLRWPTGPICPRCDGKVISRIKARKVFECDGCSYQFSVKAGTLFHDSHLPLPKWFLAIFLISESKKSISALQLKRMLKVSYKTAWYLCHRIRAAMIEANPRLLTGTVDVDETYITSGRGLQPGNRSQHTMVLAARERGGPIRIRKSLAKHTTKEVLHSFIHETVNEDRANIYTDQHSGYKGIGDANARHHTGSHSIGAWAPGDLHPQMVESAFSLFRRTMVGSFHRVSEKHLDRYLDEFEFRFNNRKNRYLFRDILLKLIEAESLPYQKLTA